MERLKTRGRMAGLVAGLVGGFGTLVLWAVPALAQDGADGIALLGGVEHGAGGVAGYRHGRFLLSDAAGNNSLAVGGYSLFRYNASIRSGDAPLTSDQEFTQGFQIAKVHLHAIGSIGQPELTYQIAAEFDSSGAAALADAWVRYQFEETPWSIRAGQFTAQVLREENVGEDATLGVERSQVNNYFNQDLSQGVEAGYQLQQVRAFVALTDGFRSAVRPSSINTPYDSTDEADFGVSLRGEWLYSGSDWARFDSFSSWRSNSTYAGLIGGAIAYQSFGDTGASAPIAGGTDLTYTLDVSSQGSGWNAFGAFVGNINDTDGFVEAKRYGTVLQGGYFVADQVELYGRYEWLRLDPLTTPGTDHNLNFLTLGVNYFVMPESNALKLSADVVYSFNRTDGLISLPGGGNITTGLLGDASEGEFDFRVQVSLRF